MSMIPESVINEIREKADIVDIIGQYVSLTKRGQNYTCSCPFHTDQNPSFSIHTGKQIYKCFSCGRGGNVFSFISEIEGIGFVEAVKKTAELADIPFDYAVTPSEKKVDPHLQSLYDIHEKAMSFYKYYLMQTENGQAGLDYLYSRQLDDATIQQFSIGLAPSQSELLYQYLKNEKFSDAQLVESGIFYQTEQGTLIDRFRGRVLFPLLNHQGKVCAFSGRTFGSMQSEAKYINSPETPIFHKNALLFNFYQARAEIRRQKRVIICEGFMDVIRLNQSEVKNAVATMGTSLTENHLNHLTKIAQEILFFFDGDSAGQKATQRAFELTNSDHNRTYKAVIIPNKMDPDEWIQAHSTQELQQLLANGVSKYHFLREFLKTQYQLQDGEQLAKYIEALIELISQIHSPIEQDLRIKELVGAYQVDEAIIREQIARLKHSTNASNDYAMYQAPSSTSMAEPTVAPTLVSGNSDLAIKSKRAYEAEKLFIQQLIYHQQAWIYLEKNQISPIFYHEYFQNLYFKLEYLYYDVGKALPMTHIEQLLEPENKQLFLAIIWDAKWSDEYYDEVMADCLRVIEIAFLEQEKDEWLNRLKLYQQENRKSDIMTALSQIQRLTREIQK